MNKILLLGLLFVNSCAFGCYQLDDKILKYGDIRDGRCYMPYISVFNYEDGKVADVLLERHFLTAGITGFEFAESNKGIYIKSRIGLKLVPFIG